ncbi:MAG: SDR family NAD(P)-dependent oxidoreductase [Bacteroidota bacterium]
MKILVTGGAGFIGSQIVDAYVEQGHQVSIIDNLSTGRQWNINPKAKFHHVDIRDAAQVEQVFRSEKYDVLNHQAAQIDVRKSVSDPAFDANVNIIGVINLLEHAMRTGVRKVIFASSGGAIYGEQDYFPADEKHPTRPISPYGIAKLTTEHYMFYYKAVHGLEFASMRYANVYGPRQNPEGEAGVVSVFTTRMLKNEQAVINGEGKQTRDYVFVGDVVKANVLALQTTGSDYFNIGTGVETDVNALFRLLKKLTGTKIEEKHAEAKKGEQMRSVLTPAKIEKALGWKPGVTLEEGLKHTVEFFKNDKRHGA